MDTITAKALKKLAEQVQQFAVAHNQLANVLRETQQKVEELEAEVGFLKCRLDNPDI